MESSLPSLELIKTELAERVLADYIEQAWPVIEPGVPFISGWHIDAICEHLEAVRDLQIKNLIINMPPRHMKSLAVSVFFPTWWWISDPYTRFLYSSYADSLSTRDALKSRRLIQSNWYQQRWGDRFQLTSDQNQKTRYDNDKYGYRISTSVGGLGTGEGGDAIICIPAGHMIYTSEGRIDIKRIVEERMAVSVLSYNVESGFVEWNCIEEYEEREAEEIMEIDLGDGVVLECTPDHLVYVCDRGYIKAGDLVEGDQVLSETDLRFSDQGGIKSC